MDPTIYGTPFDSTVDFDSQIFLDILLKGNPPLERRSYLAKS